MSLLDDKLMNFLIESLSVEELEGILMKKKSINTPKPMTEYEKLEQHYRKELKKMGICAPINKR